MIANERLRTVGLSPRTIALWGPLIRAFTLAVLLAVGAYPALTLVKIARSTYVERNLSDFGGFTIQVNVLRGSFNTPSPWSRGPSPIESASMFSVRAALSHGPRDCGHHLDCTSVCGAVLALHLIFAHFQCDAERLHSPGRHLRSLCASPTAVC